LPELLLVVLIAHRLKELNRYLRATEMVVEIDDKGIGHGRYLTLKVEMLYLSGMKKLNGPFA
jgi:hypothetical protein